MEAPPAHLKAQAFAGLAALAVVVGVVLFGAAGTFRYPAAWQFLVVFFGSSLAITLYLMKHDPQLLARRVRAGPVASASFKRSPARRSSPSSPSPRSTGGSGGRSSGRRS